MNRHQSPLAPLPIGPYSQAVSASGVVYCSGQVGLSPTSAALVDGGVAEQTEQALRNLCAVLEASHSGLKHVLKTTVMLRSMDDFAEMNKVYERVFVAAKGPEAVFPARSTYAVAGLPKGALVEIDCVAVMPAAREAL